MPISPTSSTPISTRRSAPRCGCRDGSRELRDTSQAAALEVEKFRAENGLTSARGELMSEQQLSDLNSQLILAQADTANALGALQPVQVDRRQRPGKRRQERDDPVGRQTHNSAVINDLKTRYLDISKREQEITARFGEDHPQAVALRREQADLDTADLPGAAATHRELSQRIRGREVARRLAARQCRRRWPAGARRPASRWCSCASWSRSRRRWRRSTRPFWRATRRPRSSARSRSPRRA